MKIGNLLIGAAVVLGGGWIAIETLGDDSTRSARDDAVDGVKDVGDGVGDQVNPDRAVDGAKEGADFIAGLPESFWRIIVPLLLVGGALIWVWKDPKRRSIALGVALLALAVFVIAQVA